MSDSEAMKGDAGPSPCERPWLTGRDAAILLGILLVAAALRIEDLRQPLIDAFSWRQASTAMMADNYRLRSWNVFYPEVSWTGPGPSYQGREFQIVSYLTAVLHAMFGWHDWFGRLVAIAFGVWGVLALHRAVDLLWGRTHAHAAALILAILPGAVFIDRSFLPDPAMAALMSTSLWMLALYVRTGRVGFLVLAWLTGTLGVLAKLPGLTALAGLGCIAWGGDDPGAQRRRSLALVALVLGLGPVAAYYTWAVYLGTSYPPYHVAGQGWLWDDGFSGFYERSFHLDVAKWHVTAWLWTWPAIGLMLLGLLTPPPRTGVAGAGAGRWAFHAWAGACVVFYVIAAGELRNNSWNYHACNPPAAALAGRGLILLGGLAGARLASRWSMIRMGLAVLALLIVGRGGLEHMKRPKAWEAYALGNRLAELSLPEDLVIAVAPDVGDPTGIYYSRRRGWVFPPGGGETAWNNLLDDAEAVEAFEELRSQGARWFGIARGAKDDHNPSRVFLDHHAGLLTHLRATCELVADERAFVIFRIPPPGASKALGEPVGPD